MLRAEDILSFMIGIDLFMSVTSVQYINIYGHWAFRTNVLLGTNIVTSKTLAVESPMAINTYVLNTSYKHEKINIHHKT